MRRSIWPLIGALSLCACQQEQAAVSRSTRESAEQVANTNEPSPTLVERGRKNRSQFTSINAAECRLLEEEEGLWSRQLCPGTAGYQLELSDDDLRQDIVVLAPDGSKGELRLTEIVANGAFSSLGDTAEWRGTDPDHPMVLIVRLNVARHSEVSRPDISRLVVIRLALPACIVAVVEPGPGQNERARAIADGEFPGCLTR